jgi:hypothetical protein
LDERKLQEVNQRFEDAVKRLRLDPDYTTVIDGLKELLQARTEELIYRQDTVGTHRLQGCVATLSELLRDLAP